MIKFTLVKDDFMDDFTNKLRVFISPKIPEELQKNTNMANTQLTRIIDNLSLN